MITAASSKIPTRAGRAPQVFIALTKIRASGKEATPTLSVLKTKSGHELTFDDDGEVVLLANGNGKSSIRFEQDGSVVIDLQHSGAPNVVIVDNTK